MLYTHQYLFTQCGKVYTKLAVYHKFHSNCNAVLFTTQLSTSQNYYLLPVLTITNFYPLSLITCLLVVLFLLIIGILKAAHKTRF